MPAHSESKTRHFGKRPGWTLLDRTRQTPECAESWLNSYKGKVGRFKDDVIESILTHGIARMQDGRRAKSHEAPYMKGVDYSGSARDALDQWADFLTK